MNIPDINTIQLNRKNHCWIFLATLVFLTLFMMFCHGSSSSYSGYDFFFHYQRLHTLADAIKHGVYPSFYVDFNNIEGYGYFTKGFYSDLILVPFALIGIFTSTYFAYDLMIFSMTVLCGVFMYQSVNIMCRSSYVASLSAILYTFAVYRLYDIYQRGAIAEALSFTFLPLVFLGLYYVIKGDYKKWYVLAIGYSLLIYTHVIASVLMFVVLLIIIVIYYKSFFKEPKRIVYLVLVGIITILITSYYIFPTIEQLLSNSFYLDSRRPGGGAGYGKVGFDYILWGFVSGVAYPTKELWTGIGALLTLILFSRFLIKGERSKRLKATDIGVVIGLCFILVTSRIFPWGRPPFNLLAFIQYPWRLYEFTTYFFAVGGAYYLSLVFIKRKQRFLVVVVLVLATMVTTYMSSENYKYLYSLNPPKTVLGKAVYEPDYINGYHLIGREYLPSKLNDIQYVYERGGLVESKKDDTKISALKRNYNTTLFNVEVSNSDTLVLPLIYYAGYNVTLNGTNLPVLQSDNGLVETIVDNSGLVKAYYGGTIVQKISLYISFISILLLCIYISMQRRKKNETN